MRIGVFFGFCFLFCLYYKGVRCWLGVRGGRDFLKSFIININVLSLLWYFVKGGGLVEVIEKGKIVEF